MHSEDDPGLGGLYYRLKGFKEQKKKKSSYINYMRAVLIVFSRSIHNLIWICQSPGTSKFNQK